MGERLIHTRASVFAMKPTLRLMNSLLVDGGSRGRRKKQIPSDLPTTALLSRIKVLCSIIISPVLECGIFLFLIKLCYSVLVAGSPSLVFLSIVGSNK